MLVRVHFVAPIDRQLAEAPTIQGSVRRQTRLGADFNVSPASSQPARSPARRPVIAGPRSGTFLPADACGIVRTSSKPTIGHDDPGPSHRLTGAPSAGPYPPSADRAPPLSANMTETPDPEVVAKPKRRQFTAQYRLRILEEADRCTRPGEVGRLLRREGLYSSHLATWRKARRKGSLRELAAKKRGAKPAERNPLDAKVRALEAQVARLEHELHTAHAFLICLCPIFDGAVGYHCQGWGSSNGASTPRRSSCWCGPRSTASWGRIPTTTATRVSRRLFDKTCGARAGLGLPVPHKYSLDFKMPLRYGTRHGGSDPGRRSPAV